MDSAAVLGESWLFFGRHFLLFVMLCMWNSKYIPLEEEKASFPFLIATEAAEEPHPGDIGMGRLQAVSCFRGSFAELLPLVTLVALL